MGADKMPDESAQEKGDPIEETPGRVDVALAIPLREGRVLVARRPEGAHLAGRWAFPGGRVEAGEEPVAAAGRELAEETGLQAERLEPLVLLVHDYADQPLRLHVFIARDPSGEPRSGRDGEWTWKTPAELRGLEMPEANRQMLRALRWRLGS